MPIAERLTTKWIAGRNEVDGFLDNPAAGLSFGDEEESLLRGDVVRFDEARMVVAGERAKVPHMGWNRVRQRRAHPLWAGIDDDSRFYFAHSYYPAPADPAIIAGETDYPSAFTCAIAKDNIFATQFHPEKSHHSGLRLLANFVAWNGH